MGHRNHDVRKRCDKLNTKIWCSSHVPILSDTHSLSFIGEGERRCLPFNAVYRILKKQSIFEVIYLSRKPTFYTEKKPNE